MAEGNGRQECYGYVRHPVRIAGGKTYRLRVRFRFSGLEDINRNLVHGVFTDKFNNGIFRYRKERDWIIGEGDFPGPPEDQVGEVRLYFRYCATGKVWWSQVSLEECKPLQWWKPWDRETAWQADPPFPTGRHSSDERPAVQ